MSPADAVTVELAVYGYDVTRYPKPAATWCCCGERAHGMTRYWCETREWERYQCAVHLPASGAMYRVVAP